MAHGSHSGHLKTIVLARNARHTSRGPRAFTILFRFASFPSFSCLRRRLLPFSLSLCLLLRLSFPAFIVHLVSRDTPDPRPARKFNFNTNILNNIGCVTVPRESAAKAAIIRPETRESKCIRRLPASRIAHPHVISAFFETVASSSFGIDNKKGEVQLSACRMIYALLEKKVPLLSIFATQKKEPRLPTRFFPIFFEMQIQCGHATDNVAQLFHLVPDAFLINFFLSFEQLTAKRRCKFKMFCDNFRILYGLFMDVGCATLVP